MSEEARHLTANSGQSLLNSAISPATSGRVLTPAAADHPTCPRCGRIGRSGALACGTCGLVFQDKLKTKPREQADETLIKCHACGTPYVPGALGCARCGTIFNARVNQLLVEDTHDFSAELADENSNGPSPIGAVPSDTTRVLFHIDDIELVVPPAETVIVGRMHGWDGEYPLLDLSPFGAFEKGVSRRHLRIRRKGSLVYVADLGSSNGTWLNGRRLLANGDRLLRNADELKLGVLKLSVRFAADLWESDNSSTVVLPLKQPIGSHAVSRPEPARR